MRHAANTRLPTTPAITAAAVPAAASLTPSARTARVASLLAIAAVLSLLDLALTVLLMSTTGMGEANPLARWVAQHGPLGLTAFKLALAGGGLGVLILARRRRAGEVGAWLAAGLMLLVTAQWVAYLAAVLPLAGADIHDPSDQAWVHFHHRAV